MADLSDELAEAHGHVEKLKRQLQNAQEEAAEYLRYDYCPSPVSRHLLFFNALIVGKVCYKSRALLLNHTALRLELCFSGTFARLPVLLWMC